jgi:pimeloyl-ACP methyl ester carboxylesterase
MPPSEPFTDLYLHGLSSSAGSAKGLHLAALFADHGRTLVAPDLNLPSFERLDVEAMLAAVTAAADAGGGRRVRLIGSSLGGWLAARWASIFPERVERMLLLCPAFEMETHWPRILGPAKVEAWEALGSLPLPDHAGVPRPVHWGFVLSHARHPTAPAPVAPTCIIHGQADALVPVESSRRYAAAHPERVTLLEPDDDHALLTALPLISETVGAFFGLRAGA